MRAFSSVRCQVSGKKERPNEGLEKRPVAWDDRGMSEMFKVRINRTLIDEASKVVKEIGTTPGEVVRLLFKQMVKRRTIPFPLQADTPEDEILSSPKRRSSMWEEM